MGAAHEPQKAFFGSFSAPQFSQSFRGCAGSANYDSLSTKDGNLRRITILSAGACLGQIARVRCSDSGHPLGKNDPAG